LGGKIPRNRKGKRGGERRGFSVVAKRGKKKFPLAFEELNTFYF